MPVATAGVSRSAVTVMRNVAFSSGVSSQGNQLGAPLGWLATIDPSSVSSQPRSPQTLRTGRGTPV